jgi:lipopolysaccharide transport system ATP-binding protein
MSTVIKVENVSKLYRLGSLNAASLRDDMSRMWSRIRGLEDESMLQAQLNDRTQKSTSDYVWALKDINFDVAQGDIIGIVGRNGAGKSTLLKILSKITSPTTGRIKIKGRIASLLEVGTGFHPDLTGKENMYLNGHILGMTKREIDSKFDEIVEFSGVEKYLDTPVKRYSSGMRVRLAFAVAAHLEPEILIIDEVLAVGDAEFQAKCLGKMNDVSKNEGRTILFVSHNMAAVETLCTQAILMENGRLIARDDTKRITSMYFNPSTEIDTSFSKFDTRLVSVKLNNGEMISANDKLNLKIVLECRKEIVNPHVQITILANNQYIADTASLLTGYQPAKFNEGENTIDCVFNPIILLPERSYFIRIAMRENNGLTPIIDSQVIAKFEVNASGSQIIMDSKFIGQIGDLSVPLTPYTITFNNSTTFSWEGTRD